MWLKTIGGRLARRLAVCVATAGLATAVSLAAPPPDDFRQRLVDALGACTAAYETLAAGHDSSRSDDDEMRAAARGQGAEARRLFAIWSNLDEEEISDALWDASAEIDAQDFDDDELLDLTIYCDDSLADLFDTVDSRGYTP
jgi:ATP phosphoribosyltransferase regulatory subunit HisZ